MDRYSVRLGEYNMSTLNDGPHQDIRICYTEKHDKYIDELNINDIAMITLVDDVKFNGKRKQFNFKRRGILRYILIN